ncbi:TetR/AcrR family transcriptional regulator [Piscinibacter sakaiensis]|uniref:TetR/AcrR family transcriptional regulator n=1 Tax=Piscinibacter sakaiensis TaxID=1547922 RepID=UPI003AAD7EDC
MNSLTDRRSRADRARDTRAHLIATAIEVVRTRSYGQATMFELAKAAGVTPGALQHHFGSRAELMLEVLQAILEASDESGVPWPEASMPLPQRCQALVQVLWQSLYEPPRFLAAWSVYFGSAGDAELQPRVALLRRQLVASMYQRFADVLPEAHAQPDFVAQVDLVLSALRGLGVARLFGPDSAAEKAQLELLGGMIARWCAPLAQTEPTTARSAIAPRPNNPHRPRRKSP